MRWFAIALLAAFGPALLPLCCAAFGAEPEVINGIAAIVNGDVITYSQVRELSPYHSGVSEGEIPNSGSFCGGTNARNH